MKPTLLATITIALGLSCAPAPSKAQTAPGPPDILTPTGQVPTGLPADPNLDRAGLSRLDINALNSLFAPRAAPAGTSFVLRTVDNQSVTLIVDEIREDGPGSRVLSAHTPDRRGRAVLRFDGQHLNAVIRLESGDVLIRHWQGDLYLVRLMKRLTRMACAAGRIPRAPRRDYPAPQKWKPPSNDAVAVDLLLLYTPAVVTNWACGAPGPDCNAAAQEHGVQDDLAAGLDDLNQDLACSGVYMQYRSAGIEKFAYVENGDANTDLDTLMGSVQKPILQALKAARHADLVSLIAWNETSGVGRLFHAIVADGDGYAISVVDSNQAVGNFQLAHETAHNIGAGHYEADGTGYYQYSRGWAWGVTSGGEQDVTIMTVPQNGAQHRVPDYSSPQVKWFGNTVGTAGANNALTLNLNAAAAAQFDTYGGLATMPRPACPVQ